MAHVVVIADGKHLLLVGRVYKVVCAQHERLEPHDRRAEAAPHRTVRRRPTEDGPQYGIERRKGGAGQWWGCTCSEATE